MQTNTQCADRVKSAPVYTTKSSAAVSHSGDEEIADRSLVGLASAARVQTSPSHTQRYQTSDSSVRRGTSDSSHHLERLNCPPPYPAGRQQTCRPKNANGFSKKQVRGHQVGLGTVGLYENERGNRGLKGDETVTLNGHLMVKSKAHIRRMREYAEWRNKHSDLFSSMQGQSMEERVANRERRLRAEHMKREKEEEEYALAVNQMRFHGWTVLNKEPSQVDRSRMMQIRFHREAVHAELERASLRKLQEASKMREEIAQQLLESRNEQRRYQREAQSFARLKRAERNLKKDQVSSSHGARAEAVRAEHEEMRGYIRNCIDEEEKYRKLYQSALREHALSRTTTDGLASTWSSTFDKTNGTKSSQGDWRSTFCSPLPTLPNASDSTYRMQWLEDLQKLRLASARSEVQRVKEGRTCAMRDATAQEKSERAEALRSESTALMERRLQQEAETERLRKMLKRNRAEEKKRREMLMKELLDDKRLRAAKQRRAIKAEELLVQTHKGHELVDSENQSKCSDSRTAWSAPPSPVLDM